VSDRPDRATLLAFGIGTLIAGSNFTAVKYSNKELPPFFGAGLRFAAAAFLLVIFIVLRRIRLPKGRLLFGTLLFGFLAFFTSYAFLYVALVRLPAGITGVVMGSVPLITLFLAYFHGLEPFRVRGLIGALITIVGIAVLVRAPVGGELPLVWLLAVLGAAVSAAEANIIIKKYPPVHPVSTNAIGMVIGATLLLISSLISGERWSLPSRSETWFALGYLITIGSIGLFATVLFVLARWTASAASFQFVLIPVAAVGFAAWLAEEPLGWSTLVGALIVIVGVYVGALSGPRSAMTKAPPAPEPVAQKSA
jgi:drug/metabolite transporter (DMT)-like permease